MHISHTHIHSDMKVRLCVCVSTKWRPFILMQRAVRTLHCGDALWDLPVFKLGRKLNTAAADMQRRQIDQAKGSGTLYRGGM